MPGYVGRRSHRLDRQSLSDRQRRLHSLLRSLKPGHVDGLASDDSMGRFGNDAGLPAREDLLREQPDKPGSGPRGEGGD